MYMTINTLLFYLSLITISKGDRTTGNTSKHKPPTVGISVLVRNKEHTLPYFLTGLHNLDYPKDRIYLWFYSDYNQDNSINILESWVNRHGEGYNGVYVNANSSTPTLHPDEEKPTNWSPLHFKHVIKLREEALNFARKKWVDYIFMLDADVFLTNPATLQLLTAKDVDVVAPMLVSDALYSNFWCGMTENYYYKRTDDYKPILNREKKGCFSVPMVHSAVLIKLHTTVSDKLTYDFNNVKGYNGPNDDIITFALNAKTNGISLEVCNDEVYGYLPVPLEENDELENDYEQILNVKIQAISRGTPLSVEKNMVDYVVYPEKWKFGCDEIFMINLERRSERRELMMKTFKELGMDVTIIKAVDGKDLDINNLEKSSVRLMANYEDPYHKRPMKLGEIGCFLSHYHVWEKIVEKGYKTSLVLEDDVHFVPYFRNRFLNLVNDIKIYDWDLVYIGRKILMDSDEEYVKANLVKPLYSYWTLGYLISLRGAQKLLAAKPLDKMLPVDEFLPIMFDQHPNDTWKSYFHERNLEAFSASPLLAHPTYYTGQVGYVSDTEDSNVIDPGTVPVNTEL